MKTPVPVELSNMEIALAADEVMRKTLPPLAQIPDEFRNGDTKWHQFQHDWFYRGAKITKVVPKPGIDKDKAIRHLQAIQGSFEPKHEHKVAAVAWLASLWFEDLEWEARTT